MDETAVTTKPVDWINNRKKATEEKTVGGYDGDSVDDEDCEGEAWDTLSRSFRQAQSVLDQNRELIEKVNSNHESKIPDNVAKNVGLIRQINGNISKVLSIYSDLSSSFSNIVHQQRGFPSAAVNRKNRDSDTKAVEDSPELVAEKSE